MSYIAFELDAHNKAASIATAAGIDRRWVVAGLVDMWAHCFREKTDTITSIHLLGFFGVDAGAALEAFGFLERIDRGWRVRGCARYLRVTEVRREAGKKGRATQLAAAEKADVRANAGQTAGKSAANDGFAQHLPSNSPASAQQTPGKSGKTSVLPGQKRALSPNTESSTLRVEEDSVEVCSSARATPKPAPAPHGALAGAAMQTDPPPKPHRPTAVYGTPEWKTAEALGDWRLLAWAPYPGETPAELDERVTPNAEAMKAELDAEHARGKAEWEAQQRAKQQAMAGAS